MNTSPHDTHPDHDCDRCDALAADLRRSDSQRAGLLAELRQLREQLATAEDSVRELKGAVRAIYGHAMDFDQNAQHALEYIVEACCTVLTDFEQAEALVEFADVEAAA
jgi:hypothetical protein